MSEESTRRLKAGMNAISAYFDLPKAKAARLARGGRLPGVFKLGSQFFLDEKIAVEQIAQKARAHSLAA